MAALFDAAFFMISGLTAQRNFVSLSNLVANGSLHRSTD
jgi:hypothetical protein